MTERHREGRLWRTPAKAFYVNWGRKIFFSQSLPLFFHKKEGKKFVEGACDRFVHIVIFYVSINEGKIFVNDAPRIAFPASPSVRATNGGLKWINKVIFLRSSTAVNFLIIKNRWLKKGELRCKQTEHEMKVIRHLLRNECLMRCAGTNLTICVRCARWGRHKMCIFPTIVQVQIVKQTSLSSIRSQTRTCCNYDVWLQEMLQKDDKRHRHNAQDESSLREYQKSINRPTSISQMILGSVN